MKTLRKIVALLIAAVMVFCLAACHPKDEVAVSSEDIEITSAMYLYYFIMADLSAQQRVYNSDTYDTNAPGFDYLKVEIDGKKYQDYVKDEAIKNCVKAIAYQKICKENGITLSEEIKSDAAMSAQYSWNYEGYGQLFGQNGISFETFQKVTEINYYGDTYFKHLYDKDGKKEIPEADISNALVENYAAAYMLESTYTDSTLEEIKKQFTSYKERLEKGEKFEIIKEEYEKVEEDDDTSSDSASSDSGSSDSSDATSSDSASSDSTSSGSASSDTTSSDATESEKEEEEEGPEDKLIAIVANDKGNSNNNAVNFDFAKFEDVKGMTVDEVRLIEDTEAKKVYLVVKKDITVDPYYRSELLADDLLYLLKGDEFEAEIKAYMEKIEYQVNKFAIGQFKASEIFYPSSY